MPNLKPPVTTVADAEAYRARILAALPAGMTFEPLMTLYLTDRTTPDEIVRARPAASCTASNSPAGRHHQFRFGRQLAGTLPAGAGKMAEVGLPFLLHGEVTDPDIDIFDREAVFIERTLAPLIARLPELRVVLEHITTAQAANLSPARRLTWPPR